MKKHIKKIVALFLIVLTLTGCGASNIALDLEKAKTNIELLTNEEFSITSIAGALSMSEYFGMPVDYYDWDLEALGISIDNIAVTNNMTDYSFAEDTEEGYAYFIGKAKNDELKKELDTYFNKFENVEKTELEGYLVYLASSDNEAALDVVKENSYARIFNYLMYIESADLENTLGIKSDLVSEALVATPTFITSASQYIIIKPAAGKSKEVKELMKTYMDNLQQQWDMYLPDQAELVKNREETTYGDYLIYIVSEDNAKVLETIKNSKK